MRVVTGITSDRALEQVKVVRFLFETTAAHAAAALNDMLWIMRLATVAAVRELELSLFIYKILYECQNI